MPSWRNVGRINRSQVHNIVRASQSTANQLNVTERIGQGGPETHTKFDNNIIMDGSFAYINFGSIDASNGYGFRNNNGVMEVRDISGGIDLNWTPIGPGGVGPDQRNWILSDDKRYLYYPNPSVIVGTDNVGAESLITNQADSSFVLGVSGNMIISEGNDSSVVTGGDTYMNFGKAQGFGGYGFRQSQGNMQFKSVIGGHWQDISTGGPTTVGKWSTLPGGALHPTVALPVVIGAVTPITPHPGFELQVDGATYIVGDISGDSGLEIGQDASFHQDVFIGQDLSVNQHAIIGQDLSVNRDIQLGTISDVSSGNIIMGPTVPYPGSAAPGGRGNYIQWPSEGLATNVNWWMGVNPYLDMGGANKYIPPLSTDPKTNNFYIACQNQSTSPMFSIGSRSDETKPPAPIHFNGNYQEMFRVDMEDKGGQGNGSVHVRYNLMVGDNSVDGVELGGDISCNGNIYGMNDASFVGDVFIGQDLSVNGDICCNTISCGGSTTVLSSEYLNFSETVGDSGFGVRYDIGNNEMQFKDSGAWTHFGGGGGTSNWSPTISPAAAGIFYTGGNVGIGLTDPSSALDVSGDAMFHDDVDISGGKLRITHVDYGNQPWEIFVDNTAENDLIFEPNSHNGRFIIRDGKNAASSFVIFDPSSITSNVELGVHYGTNTYVDISGDVYLRKPHNKLIIGQHYPQTTPYNLDVSGDVLFRNDLSVNGDISCNALYAGNNTSVVLGDRIGVGVPDILDSTGNDYSGNAIYFGSAPNPTDLKAGIRSNAGILQYRESGSTSNWQALGTADGSNNWHLGTNGDLYYLGGNVGIGTSNPSATLDVSGGAQIRDFVNTRLLTIGQSAEDASLSEFNFFVENISCHKLNATNEIDTNGDIHIHGGKNLVFNQSFPDFNNGIVLDADSSYGTIYGAYLDGVTGSRPTPADDDSNGWPGLTGSETPTLTAANGFFPDGTTYNIPRTSTKPGCTVWYDLSLDLGGVDLTHTSADIAMTLSSPMVGGPGVQIEWVFCSYDKLKSYYDNYAETATWPSPSGGASGGGPFAQNTYMSTNNDTGKGIWPESVPGEQPRTQVDSYSGTRTFGAPLKQNPLGYGNGLINTDLGDTAENRNVYIGLHTNWNFGATEKFSLKVIAQSDVKTLTTNNMRNLAVQTLSGDWECTGDISCSAITCSVDETNAALRLVAEAGKTYIESQSTFTGNPLIIRTGHGDPSNCAVFTADQRVGIGDGSVGQNWVPQTTLDVSGDISCRGVPFFRDNTLIYDSSGPFVVEDELTARSMDINASVKIFLVGNNSGINGSDGGGVPGPPAYSGIVIPTPTDARIGQTIKIIWAQDNYQSADCAIGISSAAYTAGHGIVGSTSLNKVWYNGETPNPTSIYNRRSASVTTVFHDRVGIVLIDATKSSAAGDPTWRRGAGGARGSWLEFTYIAGTTPPAYGSIATTGVLYTHSGSMDSDTEAGPCWINAGIP